MRNAIRRIGKATRYYLTHPLAPLERERVVSSNGFNVLCLSENLIERSIMQTGVWEPAETEAVKRTVMPGDICVDIGANIGYFSFLMATLGAKVLAFEPSQYGFERFSANLSLNPGLDIQAKRIGLGDKKHTITEAIEARFSERVLAHDHPESIVIETLDSYELRKLDFLKIDVDGHDVSAIRGSLETLKRHKPVVLAEFCERVLKPYGTSAQELGDLFLSCGYANAIDLGTGMTADLRRLPSEISTNLLLT